MQRLIIGIALLATTSVSAQQPAVEAVSIKPNAGVSVAMNNRFTPGRMFLFNYSPSVLIQQAYGVRAEHLVSLPDWARTERFDVEVTFSPPKISYDQQMQLLQPILADRFGLVVHRETREMPVYALVRIRPDGPLGPGLRPSTRDCSLKLDAAGKRVIDPECGVRITGDLVNGEVDWRQVPSNLGIRDRPVIDRTGLSGRFAIDLKWLPEGAPDSGDRVSIFTAVQEQLGLRLESTKAPIEVLVIDKIQRPTPN